MAVTPALIRELREISGAGMTDCKKALDQSEGDLQKAVVILREKGLATAAKKAGRIAAEGCVYSTISADGQSGIVIEVNCETDFVAKNPEFRNFVEQIAEQALASTETDVEGFLSEKWNYGDSETVRDAVSAKVALYGENMSIRRFERIKKEGAGFFQKYIHGEGRIAVLLEIDSDVSSEPMLEAGKNICMQIASMRPLYVSKDSIDGSFLEQEKEILTQQALNEGKDAKVVEKMITGRLNKRLKEVCLLDQEYVKDGELTVGAYFDNTAKENGANARIARFVVFEKGEGIAKKEENFAEEVSKAMQV